MNERVIGANKNITARRTNVLGDFHERHLNYDINIISKDAENNRWQVD